MKDISSTAYLILEDAVPLQLQFNKTFMTGLQEIYKFVDSPIKVTIHTVVVTNAIRLSSVWLRSALYSSRRLQSEQRLLAVVGFIFATVLTKRAGRFNKKLFTIQQLLESRGYHLTSENPSLPKFSRKNTNISSIITVMKILWLFIFPVNFLFCVNNALNESLLPTDQKWDLTPFLTQIHSRVSTACKFFEDPMRVLVREGGAAVMPSSCESATAYVALSSWPDLVGRGVFGAYSEVVVTLLVTDRDFQVFDKLMKRFDQRTYHWLMLCVFPCLARLSTVDLPLDNQVLVASLSPVSSGAKVALWDVYQPAPHLAKRASLVGRWTPSRSSAIVTEVSGSFREPWSRRTNLTGLAVKCYTMASPPTTYLWDNADGSVNITGIYGELWDALKETLNFTARCERSPDGTWGTLRDGAWTGMLGQLIKGEGDVALAPLDRTYPRSQVVSFVFDLSREWYVLVIQRPKGSSSMWDNYLREFTPSSWAVVGAFLLVTSLCLVGVTRLSPRETPLSLSDAALVVVASICYTGTSLAFYSKSNRILILTIFLTSLLVYNFYTTFLISTLTVKKLTLPFENLEELYGRRTYSFGFSGGGALDNFFKLSSQPLYRSIWDEMILPHPENLKPSWLGLQQVLEERHAYLINELFFRSKYFHCGFVILPGQYFRVPKSWAIRRNSPLFPVLDYHLKAMAESGVLVKLRRKWLPELDDCRTSGVQAMGLTSVMAPFLLLGTTMVLAGVILLIERRIWRRRLRR
ncbi:glutamate receptor ionotropic, kainate 5-like [Penaeus japonicus]|uniref:glutamate receptor ionotropic, kainate 5-like n=1 Tax=Penaeus japonicus TaxID=27405 RepID=UPI001C711B9A|nr:glutamate receptor ionotropic, kainate 5-like [Penaeus japonicus]